MKWEQERNEIMKVLGIHFDVDLAEEGRGYEVAAEPEPQYFKTLPKAAAFWVKQVDKAEEREQALRQAIKEAIEVIPAGVGGRVTLGLNILLKANRGWTGWLAERLSNEKS